MKSLRLIFGNDRGRDSPRTCCLDMQSDRDLRCPACFDGSRCKTSRHNWRRAENMKNGDPPLKLDLSGTSLPTLPGIAALFMVKFDHRKGYALLY